jgi:hypothetical protein
MDDLADLKFRHLAIIGVRLRENGRLQMTIVCMYSSIKPMSAPSPPDRAAAQAELIALADLTTPYAVRAAVGLGLPALVNNGATTIEALAERSGAPIRTIRRLVTFLTLKGVFAQTPSGNVALSAVGQLLTTEQARLMLDPGEAGGQLSLALSGLPHAVRTGTAGYEAITGRRFWRTLDENQKLAASFDRYMAGWSAQWIPDVLAARDWSAAGHIVDVGGGDGRLLCALLASNDQLKGTLVELEGAARRGREALASKGLSGRSNVVIGSFFDPLPAAAGRANAQPAAHARRLADVGAVRQRRARPRRTHESGRCRRASIRRHAPDRSRPLFNRVHSPCLMQSKPVNLVGSPSISCWPAARPAHCRSRRRMAPTSS